MRASASAATNFNTSSYHALWRGVALIPAVVAVLLCFATYGGARASALPGGDAPGELMFGGLPRTYQVHVPAGLDHPAGLVINLHGAGATGSGQAALTNYDAVADQHGFVVAYPDGIDFSWADGRGASIPTARVSTMWASSSRSPIGSPTTMESTPVGSSRRGCRPERSWPHGWRANGPMSSPPSRRSQGRWAPRSHAPRRDRSQSWKYMGPPIRSCLSAVARCSVVVGTATSWQRRRWRSGGVRWMAARAPSRMSCRVPATAPRCIASPPRDALTVLRSSSSKSTVAVTRGPQTHRKLVGSSSPRTARERSEVSRLRAGEMAQELIMKMDHNTEPIGA